ncbi:unnamed protein product [Linum tenue]|uniref:Uncharacterized protein n=1 Tax=Linum tenue TaxID=586396 RepID=A0AAV0N9Q2_9ROSI|nr:unnamed protein product [Linum tenue]
MLNQAEAARLRRSSAFVQSLLLRQRWRLWRAAADGEEKPRASDEIFGLRSVAAATAAEIVESYGGRGRARGRERVTS